MRMCTGFGVVFFCFLKIDFTKIPLSKPPHVGRARCGRQGSRGSAAMTSLSAVRLPKRSLQPLPGKPAMED